MKVFGVGLNKTGTKSLAGCFQHWGLKRVSLNDAAFRLWCENDLEGLFEIADIFDAFEDWPWPLLYRQFDARFPGSKFILTVRKDPQTWFRSLAQHALRTGPTEYRKRIYGTFMPQTAMDRHIAFYENHNAAVRAYFAGRPGDFIELCWENGDGWPALSRFLGFPEPNLAFPHANRAAYE